MTEIRRGSRVIVTEEHIRPWRGTVLSVKPSQKSGTWVEVERDDGMVWAVRAHLVHAAGYSREVVPGV